MRKTTENVSPANHDEIAGLAKRLWERDGRPSGRDLEYWLRAERQLPASRKRADKTAANRTTTDPVSSHRTGKAIRLPDSITKISRLQQVS